MVSLKHLAAKGKQNIGKSFIFDMVSQRFFLQIWLFINTPYVIKGDGKSFRKLLQDWDDRLTKGGPFLDGSQQPGLLDYELIGQMECMSCGLTDWTMPILRQYPNLMRWLQQGQHLKL